MGISCSCFSRFENALEYSDESPEDFSARTSRRASRSVDVRSSGCLDTIIETSERASSNERRISDEARFSGERRSSKESRPSSEQRRSGEARRSGERRSNEHRRSGEQRLSQERPQSDDSQYSQAREDDLKIISEILQARQIHTPEQVARFLALLKAEPGRTPSVRTSSDVPMWLKTLTPDHAQLTGNSLNPKDSYARPEPSEAAARTH